MNKTWVVFLRESLFLVTGFSSSSLYGFGIYEHGLGSIAVIVDHEMNEWTSIRVTYGLEFKEDYILFIYYQCNFFTNCLILTFCNVQTTDFDLCWQIMRYRVNTYSIA